MKKLLFVLLIMIVALSGCTEIANVENIQDVNSNIASEKNSNDVANNGKVNNEPIVLYHGISLNTIDQKVDITNDSEQKQRIFAQYNIEYNLYSNNTFLSKANGKVEGRGLDYNWQVEFAVNKSELAISKEYNPYPRKVLFINSNFQKEFESNSSVLNEINNKFNVNSKIKELCYADIDGNGGVEYLAFVVDEKNNFFAKCLIDSQFKIVSYLTVFKEKCEDFNAVLQSNNLLDSTEVVDINNDGIMEVLVTLPSYEGFSYKVFTYKNGKFDGDLITQSSLQP